MYMVYSLYIYYLIVYACIMNTGKKPTRKRPSDGVSAHETKKMKISKPVHQLSDDFFVLLMFSMNIKTLQNTSKRVSVSVMQVIQLFSLYDVSAQLLCFILGMADTTSDFNGAVIKASMICSICSKMLWTKHGVNMIKVAGDSPEEETWVIDSSNNHTILPMEIWMKIVNYIMPDGNEVRKHRHNMKYLLDLRLVCRDTHQAVSNVTSLVFSSSSKLGKSPKQMNSNAAEWISRYFVAPTQLIGRGTMTDECLRIITSKHTCLEYIDLTNSAVTNRGVAFICNNTNVKKLILERTAITSECIEHIFIALPDIHGLNLARNNLGPLSIHYITNLTALEYLNVNNNPLGDADMLNIAALTKLTILRISNTRTSGDTTFLASLNLHSLDMDYNRLQFNGLATIAHMTMLHTLCARRTNTTDESLIHLSNLHNLRILRLSSNRISDRGLGHLTELTNLVELRLNDTTISNAGIDCFAKMTKLTDLFIANTSIDAEGVTRLKAMLPLVKIHTDYTTNVHLRH